MACDVPITRRTFLKAMGSGAFTVSVSSITALAAASSTANATANAATNAHTTPQAPNGAPDWAPEPGKARWRIEGVPKVTGGKLYARDYKARDFDGWPKEENWLYALRCNCIDRNYEGFDLSVLPHPLRPIAVVSNQTLNDNRIYLASEKDPVGHQDIYLFAQEGSPANCYGQPVALLIFEDFDTYRHAKKLLDFNTSVIRYGATVPKSTVTTLYASASKAYVRDDARSFSNLQRNSLPEEKFTAARNSASKEILDRANAKVDSKTWHQFDGTFKTPAMDPVFMEPESGLAWFQADSGCLNLVLGTQSPRGDCTSAGKVFKDSNINVKHVHVISCYPGGGFGGRDESNFPVYLALAAPFAKGALRWQQSRYEQFQVGLKRAETHFTESIWLDDHGRLQALISSFSFNGGGKENLTGPVGDLAAMSAMSCYDIPRAIAQSYVSYTPALFGGSQRGFGAPQAYLAIETLMDEAAQALNKSPFDIRHNNLLSKGDGKTITGAPILFDLQLAELLNRLEAHELWRNRESVRAQRRTHGLRYGVGLAMSNQAYGTGKDAVFAMVQIQPNAGLHVLTHYTDMGNGAATTLALAPASYLGQNAQKITMNEVEAFQIPGFDYTKLGILDAYGSKAISGPFSSSSACLGAFHHFQAVDRAAMVLMLQSVLPAARALWRNPHIARQDLKWTNGKLTAAGREPIDWPALLDEINRRQLPTVAAAHVTYAGGFWKSTYTFASGSFEMDCDFIAVGTDTHNLKSLPQGKLLPPTDTFNFGRTNYAPSAALVAVSVSPESGHVKVEHVVTTLSAGRLICPEIVQGQSQGAVAMAMSNVLSESCPLDNYGPGNGEWNLDRYLITRMTDVPQQELIALPPPDGDHHSARGIGEAVMCPIAPAILNALAMATGHRFRETPVTPEKIREALK
ncbi:molybdopterin-dependent oxidoreductase [Paraburkholderia sp. CNPSo 3274]|uniref:xanthine dehydrogenase family protein molybdopterin-binding subunit n=1 Tax=Paraburkholderia sp. CNPSo 3274 TaxID=2940932 RepID=UPI0020B8CD13|nr:molybdopterin cofactor-binding domain-containing protein [Paraburkholderia sp. CNPSo 3274]MCP3707315.1 molybdopterin-dependent oxidoreductase [Paraburkholderia sp. CNPSo 3274]